MKLFDYYDIVVYTILTNEYDTFPESVEGLEHSEIKYYLLTDNPEAVPEHIKEVYTVIELPKGGIRLSRYYKINSHLLVDLIGYEPNLTIYCDASLKLQPNWWEHIEDIELSSINHCRHPSVLSEHIEKIKKLHKHSRNEIQIQYERYLDIGISPEQPITENCFIIRDNSVYSHVYNEQWWKEYSIGSERDQIASVLVQHKYDIKILPVNPRDTLMWEGWANHKQTPLRRNIVRRIGRRNVNTAPTFIPYEPHLYYQKKTQNTAMVTTFIYDDLEDKDERKFFEICLESQKEHAYQNGYKHIIFNEYIEKYPHPSWYRFQCYDLLHSFDNILWLDADIYVTKNAKSPVEYYPVNHVVSLDSAITYEYMQHMAKRKGNSYLKECKKHGIEDEVFGGYDWDNTRYINAGVLVVYKEHKDLFKSPSKYVNDGQFWEQTLLNVRIDTMNLPYQPLHRQWNAGHLHNNDNMNYAAQHGQYIHFNLPKGQKRYPVYLQLLNHFEIYGVDK
jgi:hypothetical protein